MLKALFQPNLHPIIVFPIVVAHLDSSRQFYTSECFTWFTLNLMSQQNEVVCCLNNVDND